MTRQTFDLEQLRALVAVIDASGFTAAARATGALQSTISMKIKRLEAQVDQPLLIRQGRAVVPTAAGRDLAAHARQMLLLNDRAWGNLSSNRLGGQVRLGVPDDYAAQLSDTIRAFRLQYPEVTLDLSCAFSVDLMRQVQDGALDLAVVTRMPSVPGGEVLRREPILWVSAPDFQPEEDAPLPLSVYPREVCVLRTSMTDALSAAGVPWRIAYTSMSLTGQTAMVGAGLAVTALTRSMMQQAAQAVGPASIPDLPPTARGGTRAAPATRTPNGGCPPPRDYADGTTRHGDRHLSRARRARPERSFFVASASTLASSAKAFCATFGRLKCGGR